MNIMYICKIFLNCIEEDFSQYMTILPILINVTLYYGRIYLYTGLENIQ